MDQKPLRLKLKSEYSYVQLTEEVLLELARTGMLNSTYTEDRIKYIINNTPHKVIQMTYENMGIFFEEYLVFQKDQDGNITGVVTFPTKEEMFEYFEEV